MPDPTIINQIDALIASGKLGNDQGQLQNYRLYLMQLADMAETGDFDAARELDSDYGIQVGVNWTESAPSGQTGMFTPSLDPEPRLPPSPALSSSAMIGGMEDYAFQLTQPSASSLSTPPGSALPPGTYTVIDPSSGEVLLFGPKTTYDYLGNPIVTPDTFIRSLGSPSAAKESETWRSSWQQLPDGRWQQIETSSLGRTRPLTTVSLEPPAPRAPVAPHYGAMTEDQAARAALDQAKYQLDVTKFQAGQPKLPLAATTNPENPGEESQRQEWMRARVANSENPYDYGAFAQHMAAIGAPAAPSYEGFFEVAKYEQGYQTQQDTLASAERTYQQRLGEIMAGQRLTPYQAGRLELDMGTQALAERAQARGEFETTLEAAKTGQPLTYLSLLRGTIPGQEGGGEIYQGLRPVVPSLLGQNVYGGGGAATYTPEQMTRVRRGLTQAGWPQVGTASDTEAVQAYLRIAVPDEFSSQLQSASSGVPAMPPGMATISRGDYLAPPSWPTGALRLPGVQAQANETPTERLARYEALAFQGVPTRDVQSMEERIRLSLGPGLSAGAYSPSPLRLR